jgi:hypothetical protein
MRTQQIAVWAVVGIAVMPLAGCHVEKTTHGDSKDVNITTPFGGMHVKTNGDDLQSSIGMAAYPGAEASYDDGNDNRSADVDMSFAGFQLRVKKSSYRTDDAPDKVEAFYRNELKRYGDVISCRNGKLVGSPAKTLEGLTCDRNSEGHVTVDDHAGKDELELKTGSKQHQHMVEINADGSGTKFSLVALDLPGKMTQDSDENTDRRQ